MQSKYGRQHLTFQIPENQDTFDTSNPVLKNGTP